MIARDTHIRLRLTYCSADVGENAGLRAESSVSDEASASFTAYADKANLHDVTRLQPPLVLPVVTLPQNAASGVQAFTFTRLSRIPLSQALLKVWQVSRS